MLFAVIDCGTTNSRVYILDEKSEILSKAAKKVGVRDTAINGSNAVLRSGLTETIAEAAEKCGRKPNEIAFGITSGMITSEIGLIEVPHLWAPAGLSDFSSNLVSVGGGELLPLPIPLYFVPGVKNRFDPAKAGIPEVGNLDFMRGEETQVMGALRHGDIAIPLSIVVLSSHTKFIPVSREGQILGSLTTLSGQAYEAIVKETSIGKSVKSTETENADEGYFNEEIVEAASYWVEKAGFMRAILMPRFLDTLLSTQWYERRLFLEACIAAEDMKAFGQYSLLGFPRDDRFLLIGSPRRCAIYSFLIKKALKNSVSVQEISESNAVDQLCIKGAIEIAREAKILN